MIIEPALQIQPAAGARAHGAQREASFVTGIDQFGRHWWLIDQDSQPAERVHPLIEFEHVLGNAFAADAVKTVAAGDEIALDLLLNTAAAVAHAGAAMLDLVQAHIRGLIQRLSAGGQASIHEIARDLGLAVDDHALADQGLKVDAVPLTAEGNLDTVVGQAVPVHAVTHAGLIKKLGSALFNHSGPDPAQYIVGTALLKYDVRYAVLAQQLPQQQAGGSGADNGDLSTHYGTERKRMVSGQTSEDTMPAIRHILVAVGALDAKSLPAVHKAAQIARACGARLELYHGLDTPVYADLGGLGDGGIAGLEKDLQRTAIVRLQAMADRLRRYGIKVSVAAEWDFPAYEAVVRRALRIKADLIVAHAHAGQHRLPSLLRLTDWELLRLSPIPVLLVKSARPYRRSAVLAAVDPAHAFAKPLQLDRQILSLGRVVSDALRGSLHAVHAYARVPISNMPEAGITPALIKRMERNTERAAKLNFDRVLKTSRITAARRYLIARDPASAIAQAVRRSRSAILVMGAVSRSGLRRLLIGNTAERILDDVHCDVLVVKPLKFRNRVPRAARGARVMASVPSDSLGFY